MTGLVNEEIEALANAFLKDCCDAIFNIKNGPDQNVSQIMMPRLGGLLLAARDAELISMRKAVLNEVSELLAARELLSDEIAAALDSLGRTL